MPTKMHELLAVFDDQKGQATKTRTDLMATFNNKPHLFGKKVVTFRSNQEGVAPVTESQLDINTTLSKELEWASGFLTKAIDTGYQVDLGNLEAKADLVIEDGKMPIVIAKDVPATSLLQLEKHLAAVRDLVLTIPTLDPAKGFSLDTSTGKGIYKAREVVKEKTRKDKKVLKLAAATDKHPEQVQVYDADIPVGTILEQEWSALTTPAIKSEMLARCDTLIQAVKKARSRANSIDLDVTGKRIGKQLLEYVFQPLA